MKKLTELLGLPAEATEEQIVAAVKEVLAAAAEAKGRLESQRNVEQSRAAESAKEKAISKKIAESGGALNRESAIMALEHQAEADKNRKAKK